MTRGSIYLCRSCLVDNKIPDAFRNRAFEHCLICNAPASCRLVPVRALARDRADVLNL